MKRNSPDRNPHTNRHLLDSAVQRVGGGHLVWRNIGERQCSQGAELQGSRHAGNKQYEQNHPYGSVRREPRGDEEEQSGEDSVYDQYPAERIVTDNPYGSRFHGEVADHRGQK